MSDKNDNNLGALIAGVIIGAAGAYLFGNPDGRKLKEKLLKEGQKLLEGIGEDVTSAKEKLEQTHQEIKSTAQATQNVLETAGEEITEVAQEIPKQIEEIQKKGRRFFFHKRPPTATES